LKTPFFQQFSFVHSDFFFSTSCRALLRISLFLLGTFSSFFFCCESLFVPLSPPPYLMDFLLEWPRDSSKSVYPPSALCCPRPFFLFFWGSLSCYRLACLDKSYFFQLFVLRTMSELINLQIPPPVWIRDPIRFGRGPSIDSPVPVPLPFFFLESCPFFVKKYIFFSLVVT